MGPKVINWGILGPGGIAKTFAKDLLVDPNTRGVTHLRHCIIAAASSSSKVRAIDFLRDVGAPAGAKGYGSYQELVSDNEVEIIYVATPHSHHFQQVMLCLQAGKNVLCEKPITVNAKQAKILAETAKERSLFLMEALWTRYLPVSAYICQTIASGRLGPIQRIIADTSLSTSPEISFADGSHRMVNLSLAGGSLLDLGVYSLSWCLDVVRASQPGRTVQDPVVKAALKKYRTGTDENATLLLIFPRSSENGGDVHSIAISGIRAATDPHNNGTVGPALRIFGERGELQAFAPLHRPNRTRLILVDGTLDEQTWSQPGPGPESGWYNSFGEDVNAEGEGHGMFWEADEAGDALLNGRKEGRLHSMDDTILIMKIIDEARREADLVYPSGVESDSYTLPIEPVNAI